MKVVYSEQRAQILRVTLRVVQALAVAMLALAAYVLVRTFTDADAQARQAPLLFALVLTLQAGVLATMVRWTLRRLPDRNRDARFWCLSTAVLTLFASLPLLVNLLGIVVIFVGLFLLTLALRTDPVEHSGGTGRVG